MEYKAGDKILIREDLRSSRILCGFHEGKAAGDTLQIISIDYIDERTNMYRCYNGEELYFSDEMIDHEATANM